MTKQGNNKKMKILTRNNKMAMNNLVGVSKRHAINTKRTRLDIVLFLGARGAMGGTKRFSVEGRRCTLGGHQGHQEMHKGH